MKKIILVVLFSIVVGSLFAQRNTYVGFEIPIEELEFNTTWNEAGVGVNSRKIFKYALNVRHDLSAKFAIETGLMYARSYTNTYSFNWSDGTHLADSVAFVFREEPIPHYYTKLYNTSLRSPILSTWEIPFRFTSKFQLFSNVYFAPQIGCLMTINSVNVTRNDVSIAYDINNPKLDDSNYTFNVADIDTVSYMVEHTSISPTRVGVSLEASLALEFHTSKGAFFKAFVTNVKGFNIVSSEQIRITPENESPRLTKITSLGSYMSYGISYYYPISNLWKKKSEESN